MATTAGLNKAAAFTSSPTIIIEVQGIRVLAEHFLATADATMGLSSQVVQLMGAYQADLARSWLMSNRNKAGLPNVRTGDLYKSVHPSEVKFNGNDFTVDVTAGSESFPDARASFLEFGFMHRSAGFVQYPYMMPALAETEKAFVRAMIGVARIANQAPTFAGVGSAQLNSSMSKYRARLYNTSKALGDIQVFVGNPFIGKIRTASLSAARGLGDFDSIMRGAIATRIQSRVTGRFLGAGLATSRSVTMSGPPAGFSSGANRIYNRLAGKGTGMGMRELSMSRM